MNRRHCLKLLAGLPLLAHSAGALLAAQPIRKKRLGIASTSYTLRWRASSSDGQLPVLKDALGFLEHSHSIGAGGIQTDLGRVNSDYAMKLRAKLEEYSMYLEGMASLPRQPEDIERFDRQIQLLKQAGADVVRAGIGGRRYETFSTAQAQREFAERSRQSIFLAEPVMRKHRLRLAVENHKDWLVPELVEVLKKLSSEYVGVCVDTGNSIALLEDPMAVIEAYAPYAFSTHVKDMAVQEYEEGFLLSEVPLGEGFLDLTKMIEILQRAQPAVQFSLEMITRDPLKIPCLSQKYWATFENLPGRYLAETLARVRSNASKKPLPRTTGLTQDQILQLEEANVRKCLAYAKERLGL